MITIGGLGPSLILSILFLILAALHVRKLKLDLEEAGEGPLKEEELERAASWTKAIVKSKK